MNYQEARDAAYEAVEELAVYKNFKPWSPVVHQMLVKQAQAATVTFRLACVIEEAAQRIEQEH
jgi:hypothetical protein